MKHLVLALCLYLCQTLGADTDDAQEIPLHAHMLTGAPLVEYLRKNQKLFEVSSTPVPGFEHKLMDVAFGNANQNLNPVVNDDNDTGADLPENYDPRIVWRNCSSFRTIRDQANCGSCWALSTAAAISDRICIATKGKKQVYISGTDILTCCGARCGKNGCRGGQTIEAWKFFEYDGVVSGGPYLTKECCSPYPLHPCGRHGNETFYGKCNGTAPTPPCKKRCQPGFKKIYRTDKRYGEPGRTYRLPKSEVKIRREIMERGSVVATFYTHDDFLHYKSGIYKYTAGFIAGSHAVKIIGWGKENGTAYWIIANSWHNDWGENGFFRMIRGINNCGIEGDVTAGIVDVESL